MIKDFFYRLFFQDKINDLKNVTLAYASARKTLKEISQASLRSKTGRKPTLDPIVSI